MYVIVRNDGEYVAPPGQEKTYTDKLENAWVFRLREDAERELCVENERVVSVNSLLTQPI